MKKLLKLYWPLVLKGWSIIAVGALLITLLFQSFVFKEKGFSHFIMMFATLQLFMIIFFPLFLHYSFLREDMWLVFLPLKRRDLLKSYFLLTSIAYGISLLVYFSSAINWAYSLENRGSHPENIISNFFSSISQTHMTITLLPMAIIFLLTPFNANPVASTKKRSGAEILMWFFFGGIMGALIVQFLPPIFSFLFGTLIIATNYRRVSRSLAFDKKREQRLGCLYFSGTILPVLVVSIYIWIQTPKLSVDELIPIVSTSGKMVVNRIPQRTFRQMLLSNESSSTFEDLKNKYESRFKKLNDKDFTLMLQSRESPREISSFLKAWNQAQLGSEAFQNLVLFYNNDLDFESLTVWEAWPKNEGIAKRNVSDVALLLSSKEPTLKKMGLKWSLYIYDDKIKNLIKEGALSYSASPYSVEDVNAAYKRTSTILGLDNSRKIASNSIDKCELVNNKIDPSKVNLELCVRRWTLQLGLLDKDNNYNKIENRPWTDPNEFTPEQKDLLKLIETKLAKKT